MTVDAGTGGVLYPTRQAPTGELVIASRRRTAHTLERTTVRRRRGAVMIEFAMVLPLFLFILLFTVDMGRMVLLQAGLQDATQQAARSGAQVGGADKGARSRTTFDEAIAAAPGMRTDRIAGFTVMTGGNCTQYQPNVTIRTSYRASLVTPGLGTLLGIFAGDDRGPEGDWALVATSVARCEVLRP